MKITVAFKGFPSSDALKEQVEKRVEKLEKYISYPVELHVILSVEKLTHRTEITCHAEHKQLFSESDSEDMHESIDLCVHKLEAQLKKERDRRKGHSGAHHSLDNPELASDVAADIPHRGKR
ncbi:MAG: ribosome-associated translation inhibitor RaiA [Deltaproteobacteria bacterium]|nr:ribosome-associated translation inhibitor RaiA [Deltaproteobacteria bacterium]MBI3295581.1 ribosome-associated translation inhibitor RaiA [Deltaproteobacteria bacterium]